MNILFVDLVSKLLDEYHDTGYTNARRRGGKIPSTYTKNKNHGESKKRRKMAAKSRRINR